MAPIAQRVESIKEDYPGRLVENSTSACLRFPGVFSVTYRGGARRSAAEARALGPTPSLDALLRLGGRPSPPASQLVDFRLQPAHGSGAQVTPGRECPP